MTVKTTYRFRELSEKVTSVEISPSGAGALVTVERRRTRHRSPAHGQKQSEMLRWTTRAELGIAMEPGQAEKYTASANEHLRDDRRTILSNGLYAVIPFVVIAVELWLRPISGSGILSLKWTVPMLAALGLTTFVTGRRKREKPPIPAGVVFYDVDRLGDEPEEADSLWRSEERDLALTLTPQEARAIGRASRYNPPAVDELVELLLLDRQHEEALRQEAIREERKALRNMALAGARSIHEQMLRDAADSSEEEAGAEAPRSPGGE